MPGVVVDDVGKRFGPVRAVDGVSLTVADGRLLTLLGPSGCGKTTTLRMIAGLEQNDTGRIAIGDRVVSDPAARPLRGARSAARSAWSSSPTRSGPT